MYTYSIYIKTRRNNQQVLLPTRFNSIYSTSEEAHSCRVCRESGVVYTGSTHFTLPVAIWFDAGAMATLRHPARRLLFLRPRRKVSWTHLTWRLYITKVWPGPTSRNHSTNQKAANTHTHTQRERMCSVVCAAAYTLSYIYKLLCAMMPGMKIQIDDNHLW